MSKKRDIQTDFSDRLREAALGKGLSYSPTEIGKFLGVNKQTVFNWMNGSVPRADELFQVADKFGVDPRVFATGHRGKSNSVDAIEQFDVGQKLLVLIKTFLDTTDEIRTEIVEGALALSSNNDGARVTGGGKVKR